MNFLEQPRQPLVGLFLAAIAGIIAAELWPAQPMPLLIALFVFALVLIRWRSTAAVLIFTALAFFLLHDFRTRDDPGKILAHEFSAQPVPVRVVGVIVSEPQEKASVKNVPSCQFRLRLESVEMCDRYLATDAVVLVRWFGESPVYGDRVSVSGDAANLPPSRNPGQFDYTAHLNRLGIFTEIRMRNVGSAFSVVAGDVRDDRSFVWREPHNVRVLNQVVAVLVVTVISDKIADIVKHGRGAEQQAIAITKSVLLFCIVEELRCEARHVLRLPAQRPRFARISVRLHRPRSPPSCFRRT